MATHDYIIANASGAAVRADLNNALAAIVSNNSNATSPATTYAFQFWADTTASQLKIRNAANDDWIVLMELDGTMLMEDGSASTPGLAFASDLNTGFFRSAADKINFATGGTERLEIGSTESVFNDGGADVNFRIEGDDEANLFFVDAGNDRIGIGTSAPGVLLDLESADPTIRLTDSDASGTPEAEISGAGGDLVFKADQDNEKSDTVIKFETDGSERMRIADTAVGIGLTNPSEALHVDCGAPSSADKIITQFQAESTRQLYVGWDDSQSSMAIGTNGNHPIAFHINGQNTEKVRIDTDGNLLVGQTTESSKLAVFTDQNQNAFRVDQDHATALTQFLDNGNASYTGDGIKVHQARAANSAFNFLACDSGHGGTPDREFTFRGDGNAFADGTFSNNGADYAEFFESSTGAAIPIGTAVVLENNKVRAATADDPATAIMGVVRPKGPGKASMIIGNAAWNKWSGKYLSDDFDQFILDEHEVYTWNEEVEVEDGDPEIIFHSYESHAIPEGVTVPDDVVAQTHDAEGNRFVHYRLNPDYDPDLTYVPREERDEWVIVGLVGQVRILEGQPVNDRWIKMRDVSDAVEEWLIR